MHAIILAGGKGRRLLPYTANQPKALMDVGGYPVLEIMLRQLGAAGFTRITLCVSHLQAAIRKELLDGARLGLMVDYSVDARPLGTAGPLLPVRRWESPALILNGDILTTLDFAGLYQGHLESRCAMTVAYRRSEVPIEMGALSVIDGRVRDITEKPRIMVDISLGIYVADPSVRSFIGAEAVFDMPDLIESLIRRDQTINAYSFSGQWHDIGTPDRYEQAAADFIANPELYLPSSGHNDDPIPRTVSRYVDSSG